MLDRSAVSLEGKGAIVTGGGGGMGRSISETFAAYGAAVIVAEQDAGRDEETVAAIEERGGRARAHVSDVRIQSQVDSMVAAGVRAFGRIDVLVNLVGDYLGRGGAFVRSTDDDWGTRRTRSGLHVRRVSPEDFLSGRRRVPRLSTSLGVKRLRMDHGHLV